MQIVEDKLQQTSLLPEINKMDILPDETVVISTQAESLNNTFVLEQNLDKISAKRLMTTTPHRSKPPIDMRCLTKSITKPVIQRKRVVINNHRTGHTSRAVNQENLPLIMAATRTLADPILAKSVTKARTNTNNILSAKSGMFYLLFTIIKIGNYINLYVKCFSY